MRNNEYKQLICNTLERNHLLSLAEIHKEVPGAHFASIYRNTESLCKDNILKKIIIDKNNVRYELSSHNHGHLVCNDCDGIEEITVPESIKKIHNISDMLVRGMCGDCNQKV